MVDTERVCCMCGDVGFPEKLFRCIKCHHRVQHSYCSNYYGESSQQIEQCDWCQSEEIKNSSPCQVTSTSSKKSVANSARIHRDDTSSTEKGKSPSPRTTRRYKLLKDVMC